MSLTAGLCSVAHSQLLRPPRAGMLNCCLESEPDSDGNGIRIPSPVQYRSSWVAALPPIRGAWAQLAQYSVTHCPLMSQPMSLTAPQSPTLRARLQRRPKSGPKPRTSSEFPSRSLAADSRGAGSTRSAPSHRPTAPQPTKSLIAPLFASLRARRRRKQESGSRP